MIVLRPAGDAEDVRALRAWPAPAPYGWIRSQQVHPHGICAYSLCMRIGSVYSVKPSTSLLAAEPHTGEHRGLPFTAEMLRLQAALQAAFPGCTDLSDDPEPRHHCVPAAPVAGAVAQRRGRAGRSAGARLGLSSPFLQRTSSMSSMSDARLLYRAQLHTCWPCKGGIHAQHARVALQLPLVRSFICRILLSTRRSVVSALHPKQLMVCGSCVCRKLAEAATARTICGVSICTALTFHWCTQRPS